MSAEAFPPVREIGISSRREGKRIAQGETLGDRSPEEFPPRRGVGKSPEWPAHRGTRDDGPPGRGNLIPILWLLKRINSITVTISRSFGSM